VLNFIKVVATLAAGLVPPFGGALEQRYRV